MLQILITQNVGGRNSKDRDAFFAKPVIAALVVLGLVFAIVRRSVNLDGEAGG